MNDSPTPEQMKILDRVYREARLNVKKGRKNMGYLGRRKFTTTRLNLAIDDIEGYSDNITALKKMGMLMVQRSNKKPEDHHHLTITTQGVEYLRRWRSMRTL